MKAQKIIFSDDEIRQYIVFGSEKKVNSFGLSQLFSRELFPQAEYDFSGRQKLGAYTLRARHIHKEGSLTVLVFTADN